MAIMDPLAPDALLMVYAREKLLEGKDSPGLRGGEETGSRSSYHVIQLDWSGIQHWPLLATGLKDRQGHSSHKPAQSTKVSSILVAGATSASAERTF
jgi:hypothetical protein